MNTREVRKAAKTEVSENGRMTDRTLTKTQRIRGKRRREPKWIARAERIDETKRRNDSGNHRQRE